MIHFPAWTRSSRREESNPPAAPISKIASIFKGFQFLRKNREKVDPKTSGKSKKSTPNPRLRPNIRVLSVVSPAPIGQARTPPPRPPKALKPSSQVFSSLSEVADSSTFLAHLGNDRILGSKFGDRQPASPRHPPPGQQTPLESNTNNSARAPGKAMINHHGTMHQSVVVSAPSSYLSSPNPMPLTIGDSPNPPQPFFTQPPIGPSSIPVVASSIYEGGISTGGIAEQEGNEPPPQGANTPILESGPSVGSFVALKSRWSSTTNYTTEEEELPSFFKTLKFRRRNKVNCDRQMSGKAKKSTKRIPPPPPPPSKGFGTSQRDSPSTNNLAESLDHRLTLGGRQTPNPKINDRRGRSRRDPSPGPQLPVRLDDKVDISRKKVSFIQSGGNPGPQVMLDRRHRAPGEVLNVQRAMPENARKSSRTDLALPLVQGAIRARSTPLGIPSLTVDAKKATSTKGSAALSKSDCLPTAHPLASSKATSLKTDDWSMDSKSISSYRPISPPWKPTIAASVYQGEEWASELPPQADLGDTPRLATGPSLKSFVSLRSRRSSSTSGDSEEEAFGRVRGVATNQDDEEQVSSTFTAS